MKYKLLNDLKLINQMRQLFFFVALICLCLSCGNNKAVIKQDTIKGVKTYKEDCYINPDESFDSTFVINGNQTRLKCITECYGDYIISDTINDSTIVLYRNRRFLFTLENQKIDTQIVVTKDFIKELYRDNNTFRNSVISSPRISKISSLSNSIEINFFFVYPRGLKGTDYFETIIFEITYDGKVCFKKIIPYEELGV